MTTLLQRPMQVTSLNPDPLVITDVEGVVVDSGPPVGVSRRWESSTLVRDGVTHVIPEYMGVLLQDLCAMADVWWCSTWGHDANRLIVPHLSLPVLPTVDWQAGSETKLDATADMISEALATGRMVVWIEARFGFPAVGLDEVRVVDTADPSGLGAVLLPSHLNWL